MSNHEAANNGVLSALNDVCERLGVATQRCEAANVLLRECQAAIAPEQADLLARIAAHLDQGC
jgi:hypothetical protein